MSKTALLGDTHFGGKSDSVDFIEFQRKFFENQFIPYLIENNIKRVIQVGDVNDRRTYINFRSLYHSKKNFFDPLRDNGISLEILLGNHDLFYLETLEINSPELLLREYSNIIIHRNPTTLQYGIYLFDIIPWICKENVQEIDEFIKKSQSDFCLGHFSISGFSMYKGHIAEEGLNPKVFSNYKHVWTGHFHTRSTNGNITYLGTPYEITWQDCDDPRGFYVFDDEEGTIEFIKNNYTLFTKIEYNEDLFDIKEFDFNSIKDKYVKVIVTKKSNVVKFENFIQRIYESGCHDLSIDENFEEYSNGTIDEEIKINDTLSVVNSYIDSIEIETDKDTLKKLMQRLYVEAINMEK
jgi:DNA repair exonuclease SbcCD nuclease subunit